MLKNSITTLKIMNVSAKLWIAIITCSGEEVDNVKIMFLDF
jgi:hypothetical protein